MVTSFQKAVLAAIVGVGLVLALVIAAKGPTQAATLLGGGGGGTLGFAGTQTTGLIGPPTTGIAPGIVSVGDATVRVKPDVASLSIGAIAQAPTAAEAQAQVSDRIARILQRAKDLGIPEKDTKTTSYSVSPQYASGTTQPPRITGYQAQQQLTLTWRDVDKVGRALDMLIQNDGALTANVRFTLDDAKPAQADARKLAIEDARTKADAMARAAGVRLGKVVALNEVGTGVLPLSANFAAAAPAVTGAQLPAGELEIVVRVQVQFEIG